MIIFIAASCSKNKEITPNPDNKPDSAIVFKLHQIDSIKAELKKQGYTIKDYTANQDSTIVTFTYSEQLEGAEEYGIMDFGIAPSDVQNPGNVFPASLFKGQDLLKKSAFVSNAEIDQIKTASVKASVIAGNGTHLSDYTIPSSATYVDYINPLMQIIKTDSALLVNNRSKTATVSGNYTKVQDIKNKLLFNNSGRLLQNMDAPSHLPDDAMSDMEAITATSGTYVFFRQDYAQANLDSTSYHPNLSATTNDSTFFAENNPVYVSSVICGNYGLIVFESMDDASGVLNAVNILLQQDSPALTNNQKSILNSAKSRTFYRSHVQWNKGLSGIEKLTQIKKFFDQNNQSTINLADATLTTYVKMRRLQDKQPFDGSTYTYTKAFKLE